MCSVTLRLLGSSPPVQPSGTSCSCTCCSGNSCSASLVGYASVSSCGTDCSSACRSTYSACPASGMSGIVSAVCVESSGPPGPDPPSETGPSATVTTFEDAWCSRQSRQVTVPVGVCGGPYELGPYAMVSSCSSSYWEASLFSGSTCATATRVLTANGFSPDACQQTSGGVYMKVQCGSNSATHVTGSGVLIALLVAVTHWMTQQH